MDECENRLQEIKKQKEANWISEKKVDIVKKKRGIKAKTVRDLRKQFYFREL